MSGAWRWVVTLKQSSSNILHTLYLFFMSHEYVYQGIYTYNPMAYNTHVTYVPWNHLAAVSVTRKSFNEVSSAGRHFCNDHFPCRDTLPFIVRDKFFFSKKWPAHFGLMNVVFPRDFSVLDFLVFPPTPTIGHCHCLPFIEVLAVVGHGQPPLVGRPVCSSLDSDSQVDRSTMSTVCFFQLMLCMIYGKVVT